MSERAPAQCRHCSIFVDRLAEEEQTRGGPEWAHRDPAAARRIAGDHRAEPENEARPVVTVVAVIVGAVLAMAVLAFCGGRFL